MNGMLTKVIESSEVETYLGSICIPIPPPEPPNPPQPPPPGGGVPPVPPTIPIGGGGGGGGCVRYIDVQNPGNSSPACPNGGVTIYTNFPPPPPPGTPGASY